MEFLSEIDPGVGVNGDLLLADTALRISHGADANYARPATTRPVVWRGTVTPVNMINGDDFVNLSGDFAIDGGTP